MRGWTACLMGHRGDQLLREGRFVGAHKPRLLASQPRRTGHIASTTTKLAIPAKAAATPMAIQQARSDITMGNSSTRIPDLAPPTLSVR